MKALIISFIFCCSFSIMAKEIGRVTKMRGQIFRTNIDENIVRAPLSLGGKVHEGDILESENASFAKLLMADDTVFSIGPATKFAFEEFRMKTKNDRVATYNLIKGKLRSVFTKKAPTKSLHIKTPSASMGIRGTEIVSDVYRFKGKIKTDIALLQGKLEVVTKDGQKFDMKPSDLFEAEGRGRGVSNRSRGIVKNRNVASNGFKATKKKLKKKIFNLLKKKPRKGGEVFLFDALKSERKDVSKDAEFHNLKDSPSAEFKMTRKEKDRLAIFGDTTGSNTKDTSEDSLDKDGPKVSKKALEPEENMKFSLDQNEKQDDFDFNVDVSKEEKERKPSSSPDKEKKRTNFYTPDQGPARRGPASVDKFKLEKPKKFDTPKIELNNQKPELKSPKLNDIKSNGIRKEISEKMNNPDMQRQMQEKIQENIKRQIIDARTGAAPSVIRQPTDSGFLRESLEKQKVEELERLKMEELERLKKEEYERLLREKKLKYDSTNN